ncbi:uncharacterized protein L203_100333 [Cryptococcus depauperatus CBS 7841]|uniref:Uncharacterized protein n=1 Tax=Cryptococcus depauperatus CBS 7841 TaxID=1295531 RepID=A0A1E3IYZ1_9TREE|nr:solute carrier family 29 (equilibrative nucleoside transporter), member 1/2/3 [Cryptococcus depauperatus CBS 7841]
MISTLKNALESSQKPISNSVKYQPVASGSEEVAATTTPTSCRDECGPDEMNDEGASNDAAQKAGEYKEVKVYLCFWVLGAGVLLSWNALICTYPLLISFFPRESKFRSSLPSLLGTVYCLGNLTFLGFAQRYVGTASPAKRLESSLLTLLIISLLLTFPFIPFLFSHFSTNLLLLSLILLSLMLSYCTAFLQFSVFALSSLWGYEQTLAVMSGQGGIALLISGIQLLLAFVSAIGRKEDGIEQGKEASKLVGAGLWAACSLGVVGCFMSSRHLKRHPKYHVISVPVAAQNVNEEDARRGREGLNKKIARKNWELNLAITLVFMVSLSVFPPVTTRILSTHQPIPRLLQPDIFIPLHFMIFNIGDYVGRTYLPLMPALFITSPPRILVLSILRALFIPLFFACNVTPRALNTKPNIDSDVLYFIIMLFFAASNGWLGSLCMIISSSPSLNPRIKDEERDVAATLASFCLVAGLAGGSLASFASTWAIGRLV